MKNFLLHLLFILFLAPAFSQPCTITVNFSGSPSSCDDNGTPNDSSDDFFTQNVQANFTNRPFTGNLQIVPGGDQIGVYSIPVAQIIGNAHIFFAVKFKADNTPTEIQMNFTDDPGCINDATGPTVQPCSDPPPPCTITVDFLLSQSDCNDNGTPNDPTDDFFTKSVQATFLNRPLTGDLQIVPGGDQIGDYSIPVTQISGNSHILNGVKFKADGTPTVIQMNFTDDPGCIDEATGPTVQPCSAAAQCAVNSVSLQNIGSCNDNGTSDPSDDFFTANVKVTFTSPPATGNLEIELPGDVVPGGGATSVPVADLVGNEHTFTGVRFKADGTVTVVEVQFSADNACVRTATGPTVQPCSVPCSINSVALQNQGSCDDNGTSDPSDDFFTADVKTTFTSPPASGNLEIELPGDVVPGGGATSVPVADLVGNEHTFTGVRFKADGTITVIEMQFSADNACVRTATGPTVQPCSYAPPVLTCPGAIAVSCASQVPAANPANFSETHDCPGNISIIHLGDVSGNVVCINKLTITRTYQGTDQCGQSTTCSQTITVNDQSPPTVTCPTNLSLSCANQVPAIDANSIAVTDNCPGGAGITRTFLSETISNQTCANRFTLTRTYRGGDACGNTATCSQTITVNDQTGPSLSCPVPQTFSCAEQVPAPNPALVTGSDNCGGAITPSFFSASISNQSCPNRFTLTRQYRASDLCGNTSSCTQVITVNDQTPPTFTSVPANVTVDCYLVPGAGIATASDNCTSGATVVFLGQVKTPGICPVLFMLTRTWRATDACGNSATASQVITVTDTNAPQFLVLPKNEVVECGPADAAEFQAFLDNRGGAVAQDCAQITYSHEDSPFQNNSYNCGNTFRKNIRFIATDECGNSAFLDASFTVVDQTAPVFTTPPQNLDFECDADDDAETAFYDWLASDAGLVAEDACGSVTLEKVLIGETQGCGNTWRKTYEFRARDECDNLSKIKASFAVVDNRPPTLVCAPNDNVYLPCIEAVPAADPTALIAWDCSGVTLSLVDTWTVGTGCPNWPMTVAYRYAATDGCGNQAFCERAFYVKESSTPVLFCPDTIKLACAADIPGPGQLFGYIKTLLAGDCAGGFSSIDILADSGQPQNGATHRTYAINAKNHCGLITSACTITFMANSNCNQFCTATGSDWGDPNGSIGGMNTAVAIEQLIAMYGPVTVGGGGHTVTAADADCLQELLPGSGDETFLPTGHFNCPLPAGLSNADGSLNNLLAADAMALQLNIWYNLKFNNRDLGVQDIHNLPPCLVEFALLKDLGQHNTVQDLLNLTNQYLQNYAGYYAPELPALLHAALENLNLFRLDCGLNAPCERPAIRARERSRETGKRMIIQLYPNPTADAALLDFWAEDAVSFVLKIWDTRGGKSERKVLASKGKTSVEISLEKLPAGVYWVSLQNGIRLETLRLVKVEE